MTQTFQFGHFEERSTTTDGAELPQTWLGYSDVLDTERQTFNWQRRVPLAGGNQAISYGVDWDREQASMQPESYGSKSRQTNSVFSDYFWRYPDWQLSAGGRLAHNSQYGSKLTHSVDLSLTRQLSCGSSVSAIVVVTDRRLLTTCIGPVLVIQTYDPKARIPCQRMRGIIFVQVCWKRRCFIRTLVT